MNLGVSSDTGNRENQGIEEIDYPGRVWDERVSVDHVMGCQRKKDLRSC